MRRVYAEVANSYAPFRQAVLQGLGQTGHVAHGGGWRPGRTYYGIEHFRAPYDEFGYFQDNTLNGAPMNGLGAVSVTDASAIDSTAEGSIKRFLTSGEPVSSLRSDVTLPFNQVHPYVYGGIALAALATSYYSYKRWKKTQGKSSP